MTRGRRQDMNGEPAGRVTPVEVFFDLVFVFTLISN
jgi:low temperature requirement protein LtrA